MNKRILAGHTRQKRQQIKACDSLRKHQRANDWLTAVFSTLSLPRQSTGGQCLHLIYSTLSADKPPHQNPFGWSDCGLVVWWSFVGSRHTFKQVVREHWLQSHFQLKIAGPGPWPPAKHRDFMCVNRFGRCCSCDSGYGRKQPFSPRRWRQSVSKP